VEQAGRRLCARLQTPINGPSGTHSLSRKPQFRFGNKLGCRGQPRPANITNFFVPEGPFFSALARPYANALAVPAHGPFNASHLVSSDFKYAENGY
jgi:hypothetical protein